MMRVALVVCLILALVRGGRGLGRAGGDDDGDGDDVYRLPSGFLFGAGSSNHQIEGAWNEDGKAESQVDRWRHAVYPNESNGDVAVDSYHQFREDVRMLKYMKVNAYRFSMSWSRLLPTGRPEEYNEAGVQYYNALLDELIKNNITPVVTMYHDEHPQLLEDQFKGWLSPDMVDYFENYAGFLFETFGDRVKWWTTLNEPFIYSVFGYGYALFAPGTLSPGRDEYLAVHHMILAHGRAYRLYQRQYAHQAGRIGLCTQSYFSRPQTVALEDVLAAERRNVFELAWVLDPLLTGDYPALMRKVVDGRCLAEGLAQSRLPTFTEAESELVKGTLDFIGLNAYFGLDATDGVLPMAGDPSFDRDCGVFVEHPDDRGRPDYLPYPYHHHSTPWSIRESLLWLRNRYGDVAVVITENGIGSTTEASLNDDHRIKFHSDYLRVLLRAVNVDKCNVVGYFAWSLLDSFEWNTYEAKFGLVHVDLASPNKTRTPKKSADFVRRIMEDRFVPAVADGSSLASCSTVLVLLALAVGHFLSQASGAPVS